MNDLRRLNDVIEFVLGCMRLFFLFVVALVVTWLMPPLVIPKGLVLLALFAALGLAHWLDRRRQLHD